MQSTQASNKAFSHDKVTKKILFLVPIFGGGGGERIVSELSSQLPTSINQVLVAFELKNHYPFRGKRISLALPLSTSFSRKVRSFAQGFFKFRRILKQEKPEYVMSFGNMQNILNILCGTRALVRVDNYISEGNRREGRLYRFLVGLLFPKAHKVIAVSKGIERDLVETFHIPKEKVQVIYNPVDIRKIEELSREDLSEEHQKIFEAPVIINIGSFIEQKGQDDLIRAFAAMRSRDLQPRLVFLGEGAGEVQLQELAKLLGVEEHVHFLGWQKNPFKFLVRSHVFVLPSRWEGFGIVLVEALACGLPVISTDCKAGPREILAPNTNVYTQTTSIEHGDYGILVPVSQPTFLASALELVFRDSKVTSRFRENAKVRAEEFDIRKIFPLYQALFSI